MVTEATGGQPDEAGAQALAMKQDVLRQIFGDVALGSPLKDYSCAVESKILLHGRMFVTSTSLCFYSNVFGVEKRVLIPFAHIRSVEKGNTALLIPNAIVVHADKQDYVFRSFWVRDKCFRTLTTALDTYRATVSLHGQ